MRPPTEAASPVVTDGYGSTSTMYRRIVFWTDLTFSRRSQHCGFRKPQIRAYRWCSPPRIGCAIMSPNRSIGRVQGCVLAKRKGSPDLIIVAGVFRKNAPKVIFVQHDHVVRALVPRRPDQALN